MSIWYIAPFLKLESFLNFACEWVIYGQGCGVGIEVMLRYGVMHEWRWQILYTPEGKEDLGFFFNDIRHQC